MNSDTPDPCSKCGGKGYIYLPMDQKGQDDTCPKCGGSGQTEEGMAQVERQRRKLRQRKGGGS